MPSSFSLILILLVFIFGHAFYLQYRLKHPKRQLDYYEGQVDLLLKLSILLLLLPMTQL